MASLQLSNGTMAICITPEGRQDSVLPRSLSFHCFRMSIQTVPGGLTLKAQVEVKVEV